MLAILTVMAALPAFAAAASWNNVPIVDSQCAAKVKANPDIHARSCALACAKSGFGIVDENGNYLKFDERGNQQALKALESSSKKDHLRVTVSGQQEGNTIHVQSLHLM